MEANKERVLLDIRKFMVQEGLTQNELADKLGISRSTMSNILAGRYTLSMKVAKKLSDLYGFNLEYLLTGEGELERNLRKVGNVSGGAVTQGDDSPIINQNDELVRHLQEEVKFLRETIASMTKNCK